MSFTHKPILITIAILLVTGLALATEPKLIAQSGKGALYEPADGIERVGSQEKQGIERQRPDPHVSARHALEQRIKKGQQTARWLERPAYPIPEQENAPAEPHLIAQVIRDSLLKTNPSQAIARALVKERSANLSGQHSDLRIGVHSFPNTPGQARSQQLLRESNAQVEPAFAAYLAGLLQCMLPVQFRVGADQFCDVTDAVQACPTVPCAVYTEVEQQILGRQAAYGSSL